MSERPKNFEPYLDYSRVTDEMASDLKKAVVKQRSIAQRITFGSPSKELVKQAIESWHELNETIEAITSSIYTEPTMVHVAGEKKNEEYQGIENAIVQRCSRCGSVLQVWHDHLGIITESGPQKIEEEEMSWWEEGERVGKSQSDGPLTAVYQVEKDRDLHPYEFMCVEMPVIT